MSVHRLDDHRQAVNALRTPPVSIEAEAAVLGAVLINNEAYGHAAGVVRAEHFSEEIHRRIFAVMGDLLRAGRPVTAPGLIQYLGNHEIAPGVTTATYMARLIGEALPIINTPDYAKIVRDTAVLRDLIAAGNKVVDAAYDARVDASPDDVAAEALAALRTIVEAAPRGRSRFHLGQGMAALVDRIGRIQRGEEQHRGITTGFSDLDRALGGGLLPATIVVGAGRVGMGKTVLMTNLAYNAARSGVGVLEFSLEIPDDEIKARHLAQAIYDDRDRVPFTAILKALDLTPEQTERIVLAQRDFLELPIVVECPPAITAAEIAARIGVEKKAMAARGTPLGLVLIDYLDKIGATDRYAGQRTYELQEIVTTLKTAARTEDVCIVLLAQLNRGPEGRDDKRPSLADIKSSSFIEQEAHAIIFVYREAYYIAKSAEYRDRSGENRARFEEAHARYSQVKHDVELILGKNRGGEEETVVLWGDVGCSKLGLQGYGRRQL